MDVNLSDAPRAGWPKAHEKLISPVARWIFVSGNVRRASCGKRLHQDPYCGQPFRICLWIAENMSNTGGAHFGHAGLAIEAGVPEWVHSLGIVRNRADDRGALQIGQPTLTSEPDRIRFEVQARNGIPWLASGQARLRGYEDSSRSLEPRWVRDHWPFSTPRGLAPLTPILAGSAFFDALTIGGSAFSPVGDAAVRTGYAPCLPGRH